MNASRARRRHPIDFRVAAPLKTLHKELGGVGRVFDPFPLEKHLAPRLRRDLKRAGVVRAELFVTDSHCR